MFYSIIPLHLNQTFPSEDLKNIFLMKTETGIIVGGPVKTKNGPDTVVSLSFLFSPLSETGFYHFVNKI